LTRSRRAALLLLAAALAAPAAPAAADDWTTAFPKGGEVFTPLLADPREIRLSASYYRLRGENDADAALGHSWGLVSWRTGILSDWLWQADAEAMAYARFQGAGAGAGLQAVDYAANLPVEARKGPFSFKAEFFHRESHLGDDVVRETGGAPFRSSAEGVRGLAAVELLRVLRVYAGPTWLVRTEPSPRRWTLQSGFELTFGDLHWSARVPVRLFLAEDVQSREDVRWNLDSKTTTGLKIGLLGSTRAVRVQAGYFTGHSAFGQFYAQPERYADVGLVFEL
jgi:hypothetical protein